MWMRLTLTVNRAAILKRSKRIWPIEATASSVPFKTAACRVLMIRCAKAENQSRNWLEANDFALIPEPEEKGSELLRDLTANDNGANRWHLYEDLKQSNKFRMEVVVPSWKQHLLQLERRTKNEKDILLKLRNLRIDPNPEEWISLSGEKEVLNRRVRTGGLPPGYIDQ